MVQITLTILFSYSLLSLHLRHQLRIPLVQDDRLHGHDERASRPIERQRRRHSQGEQPHHDREKYA